MAMIDPIQQTLASGDVLTIRTPLEADCPALVAFRRYTAANTDQILTQPHECPETAEQQWNGMKEFVEHPSGLFLIGEVHDSITGLLTFIPGRRERSAHTGILGITVAPEWQGKGIGTALMRTLIDWARAHPRIEKVCLEVFHDNDGAIRLYQRLGFQEEGRRYGQAQITPGNYADDICMALWVKPRRTPPSS